MHRKITDTKMLNSPLTRIIHETTADRNQSRIAPLELNIQVRTLNAVIGKAIDLCMCVCVCISFCHKNHFVFIFSLGHCNMVGEREREKN